MSRVAAAVHLVTTDGVAGRAGMTATAVTSVTDNPATILVCINSSSRSCKLLQANGVFGVSVLTPQDQKLASVFAGLGALPWEERFSVGDWTPGITGSPLLRSGLATFDCRVCGTSIVATHQVVLGEVVDVRLGERGEALLYYGREYRQL